MQLQIDKLIRGKRRTISLIVERDGTLTVRAPMRVPHAEIDSFVLEKADWIIRTRQKMKSIIGTTSKQYVEGEQFLFLGSSFDLKLVKPQRPSLQFDGGFHLNLSAQKKGKVLFIRWYKERAFEVVSERVAAYSKQYDFSPKQVKITSAQTRWGSCGPNGTLNFVWRLVMAPMEVIDYVVVHELVHLRVTNHSKKFWRAVESILPQYNVQRKWLREQGIRLML